MNKQNYLSMGLALALTTVGCGDDSPSTMDSSVPADGGVDAMADASVMDGSDDSATPMDGGADAEVDGGEMDSGTLPGCEPGHLLVVTSDFSTGGLGSLDLTTDTAATNASPDNDQDATAQLVGCTGVVIERGVGNLRFLSDADLFTTERNIDTDPAGATGSYASNPQKVVVVSDTKAYVLRSMLNELLVVDPAGDGPTAISGTVDLSVYLDDADTDGVLEVTDAILVGDLLYIALGRYFFDASFAIQFAAGSVLAILDTTDDSLVDADESVDGVQGIALMGNNPWRGLWHDEAGDSLWVATSGDGFAFDGGLERVDLSTNATAGYLLEETTLGAELNGYAVMSSTRVLVLAGTDVILWNPTDDSRAEVPVATGVSGMRLVGDDLFTFSSAGLRRFIAADGTETTPAAGPWTFGALPITSIAPAP